MLKCLSRYRNAVLGIFAEPGEVLRDLYPGLEEFLLRDSPGSFRQVKTSKAVDAPDKDKLMARENVTREASETELGPIMTRENMPGLLRPKG